MKKNNQKLHKKYFVLTTLAASVLLVSHPCYALEALDDSSMRSVNAQDGLHVNLDFKELNVGKFFWEDNAGRGSAGKSADTTLRAEAENFKIPYLGDIPLDKNGRIAIDWGVYGITETFIVSSKGIIKYRHVGPITKKIYKKINLLIKEIE